MNSRLLGRTLGVLALLGLTAYDVPAASASAYEPAWSMKVENVPSVVAAGSGAAFQAPIDNPGSTKITRVVLRTDTTAKTTSVTIRKGSCAPVNKKLRCSLGTLRDDADPRSAVRLHPDRRLHRRGDPLLRRRLHHGVRHAERRLQGDGLSEASPRLSLTPARANVSVVSRVRAPWGGSVS